MEICFKQRELRVTEMVQIEIEKFYNECALRLIYSAAGVGELCWMFEQKFFIASPGGGRWNSHLLCAAKNSVDTRRCTRTEVDML